jgi:sigma-E factor negative regulatory protein RseA
MTNMDTRISELMDGEQAPADGAATARALTASGSRQDAWRVYHLIGDAMRREAYLALDVRANVMAALAGEPTVIAPRAARECQRRLATRWRHAAMAAAAAIAGVAVVAWVAVTTPSVHDGLMASAGSVAEKPGVAPVADEMLTVARTMPATTAPAAQTATADDADRQLQEYLLAHQAYAAMGLPVGVVNHIHTVSAAR